jgi:hypothetical protein
MTQVVYGRQFARKIMRLPLQWIQPLLAAVAWQPATAFSLRTLVVPRVSSSTRLSQFGDRNLFVRTRSRSSRTFSVDDEEGESLAIPSTEELDANLKDWEERTNKATVTNQLVSVQKELKTECGKYISIDDARIKAYVAEMNRISAVAGDKNIDILEADDEDNTKKDESLAIPSTEEMDAKLKDWEERTNKATDTDQLESVQKELSTEGSKYISSSDDQIKTYVDKISRILLVAFDKEAELLGMMSYAERKKLKDWEERTNKATVIDKLESLQKELWTEYREYESFDDAQNKAYVAEIYRILVVANDKKYELLAVERNTTISRADYAIGSSPLKFDHDLDLLTGRIHELFDWHHTKKTRERYWAPYFPIVQSSGMGKTKLLYEYKQRSMEKDGTTCVLLRCVDVMPSKDEEVTDTFDCLLKVPSGDGESARTQLVDRLNEELKKVPEGKVVLMFDEAHHLMMNDGFAFRVVRWWIRDDVPPEYQLVAVFCGTSSKLANFFKDPPMSTTSRDPKKPDMAGKLLYKPFYSLCTIGCLSNDAGKENATTEYGKAAYHGRPLFARMQSENILAQSEGKILMKMLLGDKAVAGWQNDCEAVFSILATRVQMGRVSVPTMSRLVESGYAGLTLFRSIKNRLDVAQMCHYPDPVCARLAMCLMDEGSTIGSYRGYPYRGKPKVWWAKRAQDQFSSGFCLPSHGDAAEVFTALYLLFCGDVLRARSNEPGYKIFVKFSVSLRDWVGTIVSGGDPPMVSNVPLELHDDTKWQPRPEINFIQVCHNYLRFDVEDMLDEQVLGDMYEGGTAYYSAANTEIFDLFASIRYKDRDGKIRYAPLLVQVKSTSKSIGEGLENMAEIVKNAGYTTALCVLVRFGADTEEKTSKEKTLVGSDIDLFGGQIISKILVVPRNDAFGLTTAFRSASFDDGEISELLTSHRLIASLAQSANGMRLNKEHAFRRNKYFGKEDAPLKFLTGFWESLRKSSDDGSKDPME